MAQRPADRPSPEHVPPEGWVRLATLGRPFQVRGALKAHTTGPGADVALRALAAAGGRVWLSELGATRLREARPAGGGLALAFQGVYTPEQARTLVHQTVWSDPSALPPEDDDGAVPVERLEGADVTLAGEPYGRVVRVLLGAQDLLVVDGPDGERWLPWAAPYVTWDGHTVDVVDPPAGLLDDPETDDASSEDAATDDDAVRFDPPSGAA